MGYFSEIDINGYDVVVVVKDYGTDGHTPYIGENGNWWINGEDTGSSSIGVGIDDISKTDTIDNIDYYTITYTDDTTYEFEVHNGIDGIDGIDGVGVPNGGTTNQVLVKKSDNDFDTEWVDVPSGGGGSDFVTIPFTNNLIFDQNYQMTADTQILVNFTNASPSTAKNGKQVLVKLTGSDASFGDNFIKMSESSDYDGDKINIICFRYDFGKISYRIYNYEKDVPFDIDIHKLWISPLNLTDFDQEVYWNGNPYKDYVHPYVLYIPNGWNGYKYINAITPYPATQSELEDPMLFVSNNPLSEGWITMTGTPVPLYSPDANTNHFSDPSICLDDDGETLHYIFRGVYDSGANAYIAYTKTTDGVNFDPFIKIIDTANGNIDIVSPNLIKHNGDWYIFATENVNQDKLAVYKSSEIDDPLSWGKINDIDLGELGELWHCEVRKHNDKFYVLGSTNWIQGGYLRMGVFLDPMDSVLDDYRNTVIAWTGGAYSLNLESYYKSSFIIKEDNTIEFYNGVKGPMLNTSTRWRVAMEQVLPINETLQPILDSMDLVDEYPDTNDSAFSPFGNFMVNASMFNEFYTIEATVTEFPFELLGHQYATYTRTVMRVINDKRFLCGYFNQGGYYELVINIDVRIGDKIAIRRFSLDVAEFYLNNVKVYEVTLPQQFIDRKGTAFGSYNSLLTDVKIYADSQFIPSETRFNGKLSSRLTDALTNQGAYFWSDTFDRASLGIEDEIGNDYINYGFDIDSNQLAPTATNCRIAVEVNAPFEATMKLNSAAQAQGSFIIKYTDENNFTFINNNFNIFEKLGGVNSYIANMPVSKGLDLPNFSFIWDGEYIIFKLNDAEIGRVEWDDVTHFGYANLFANERISEINVVKL